MPLLVERLEQLYAQMWDDYLSGRLPQPDLTNFAIYTAIGDSLDPVIDEGPDLGPYEQRYETALAYHQSLAPIPFDGRLNGAVRR